MKLLGKDGGQTRVPALLLLAASPVVRIILSDRLPSSHSLVVTFQGVTEDTLKVFGGVSCLSQKLFYYVILRWGTT